MILECVFVNCVPIPRCLKIRDVCMDFEPCFKAHSLVSVHPNNIILGQMTSFNMTFPVVVSVNLFLKI